MSDYGGFKALIQEAKALAENPPPVVACPKCGEILVPNAKGELNCPMGHFRTSQ